jgi:hypothetical protein
MARLALQPADGRHFDFGLQSCELDAYSPRQRVRRLSGGLPADSRVELGALRQSPSRALGARLGYESFNIPNTSGAQIVSLSVLLAL